MQFFSGLFSGKFCINYLVGVTTLDLKFSMHETELSSHDFGLWKLSY